MKQWWIAAAALVLGALAVQAQEAGPQVQQYDLGTGTIIQSWFDPSSRFYEMPIPVQGTLAVPEGEGPFPVVLIAHGSHPRCTAPLLDDRGGMDQFPCPPENVIRSDTGLEYLARALAEAGYIAVVPNTNEVWTNGFGEDWMGLRPPALFDLHLQHLAAANRGEEDGFGVDLTGKVDLSRLYLIGHSQGGDQVNNYARDLIADGSNIVPQAILLVAATPVAAGFEVPDVPVAVTISQCDGDIGTEPPDLFVAVAQSDPDRLSTVDRVWLPRANHNAFNSNLGPDFLANQVCEGQPLLSGDEQRAWLVDYALRFFDGVQPR